MIIAFSQSTCPRVEERICLPSCGKVFSSRRLPSRDVTTLKRTPCSLSPKCWTSQSSSWRCSLSKKSNSLSETRPGDLSSRVMKKPPPPNQRPLNSHQQHQYDDDQNGR